MTEQRSAILAAGLCLGAVGLVLLFTPDGLALGAAALIIGAALALVVLLRVRVESATACSRRDGALRREEHRTPRHQPPMQLPYYRAPFGAAVTRFFRKYATFRGRASRAEYWWWRLVEIAVPLVITAFYGVLTGDWQQTPDAVVPTLATWTFGLGTLVPSLALTVRRLHDADHTGRWVILVLVPVVGWIILLIFALLPPSADGVSYDGRSGSSRPAPAR